MTNKWVENNESGNLNTQAVPEKSVNSFVGGMIVGAAVGAAAGAIASLLVAPQDGQETRKLLKKSVDALPEVTNDVTISVQFQTKRLVKSSLSQWEQTLLRLRTAITTGIAVSQQERQRLTQSTKSSPNTTETIVKS